MKNLLSYWDVPGCLADGRIRILEISGILFKKKSLFLTSPSFDA